MTDVLDLDALRQTGARDARGRWQAGNKAALRHGLRVKDDPPDLATAIVERYDAIVGDLGGPDNLTTAEHLTARELARVSLLTEAAGEALLRDGLLTARGRARSMVAIWQGLVDRQMRLAAMVGLQRRAKPAGADLRAYAMEHGQ